MLALNNNQHASAANLSCIQCNVNSSNKNTLNLRNKCSAIMFPFFNVNDIEFKLLLGRNVTDCNVLFNNDDYFSPSHMSKLASKQEQFFYHSF